MPDTEALIERLKGIVGGHSIASGATRLAFIVGLAQEAADIASAHAVMREQIGTDFVRDADQDFVLRLNRRAHVGGRECNRIYMWSVAQLQAMQAEFALPMMMPGMQIMTSPQVVPAPLSPPPRTAAFANVDVNTVPDANMPPFAPDEQRAIFPAFADGSLRLCRENCLGAL